MVFSFICDIKICVSVCNSVNFMNSFRIFVSISSAKGSKTFSVAWVSTVADRRICSVRLIMYSALLYELSSSSACFSICLSTQENINYYFFFSPSNSKQSDNTCARSIQIPSGRRQNTSGSECASHPVARSISTFGPLEEDEKENQMINHIIPTGSLPATLQGPTVCSFSTLNVVV